MSIQMFITIKACPTTRDSLIQTTSTQHRISFRSFIYNVSSQFIITVITIIVISIEHSLLQKLTVAQLVKKFTAFNVRSKLITVLSKAYRWILPSYRRTYYTNSYPILRFIWILSSDLCLHLLRILLPSGFRLKFYIRFSFFHCVMRVTCI
jgi:hypothetical protein